jgi:hypothetical protein
LVEQAGCFVVKDFYFVIELGHVTK